MSDKRATPVAEEAARKKAKVGDRCRYQPILITINDEMDFNNTFFGSLYPTREEAVEALLEYAKSKEIGDEFDSFASLEKSLIGYQEVLNWVTHVTIIEHKDI